ncbi:MAG TPA: chromate efflux transporter [Methylomirabilota bacterium]
MPEPTDGGTTNRWKEIATGFLKIGATGYGGPAIMGVMQAEFQERRQWVSKPQFVEGLALVNVLPGATAVELGIFLGYARGGWWGGLVAGLCFAAPGFVVMLALALAYATLDVNPIVRSALYGLGPVVLAIFVVALVRLGRSALRAWPQRLIATAAAVAALLSPIGAAAILLLAGAVGLFLFHSRRAGAIVLLALTAGIALMPFVVWSPLGSLITSGGPGFGRVIALFSTIGTVTFGGGLSMIALVEEHVVHRLHWLTPPEFIAGLALGQLTPGPILMVAAFIGYKLLGVGGAVAAAVAMFLPSFVLMLAILPAFDRVRKLTWMKAVIQGIGPAVIGVMAVALSRLAPASAPDPVAVIVLVAAVAVLLFGQVAPLPAMLGGAVLGVARSWLAALPGLKPALGLGLWVR